MHMLLYNTAVVDAHITKQVPGSRYYSNEDTSTYKRSMCCHPFFASHNRLAGPAVGLHVRSARSCIVKEKVARIIVLLACEV